MPLNLPALHQIRIQIAATINDLLVINQAISRNVDQLTDEHDSLGLAIKFAAESTSQPTHLTKEKPTNATPTTTH
jgi:hypothetical protein